MPKPRSNRNSEAPARGEPEAKSKGKSEAKSEAKPKAKSKEAAAPSKAKPAPAAKPAFPKKSQPPTAATFAALLPLAVGKRLEMVRAFLLKQPGVAEDVYFYGPSSGWGLRYLAGGRPVCSLFIHGQIPVGIAALDAQADAALDWKALSPVAQAARKSAHGSPSLLWIDVPLDSSGAADFKAILKGKLASAATPSTTRAAARG